MRIFFSFAKFLQFNNFILQEKEIIINLKFYLKKKLNFETKTNDGFQDLRATDGQRREKH